MLPSGFGTGERTMPKLDRQISPCAHNDQVNILLDKIEMLARDGGGYDRDHPYKT